VEAIETIYRREAPQVLATLIRLLGSFELAEEAVQMAFLAAAQQWPAQGAPRNPRAWLVSAGRFKAIDMLRRRKRFVSVTPELIEALEQEAEPMPVEDETVPDDMLRLIFVCCHPALPPDAQTALCLREVCGLTTEAIAAAFLAKPAAIGQRIVRAKTRIRNERIAYVVPEGEERDERLDAVLRVVYLVFSEGHSASSGESLLRAELCSEAIRLARLLKQLLPHPDIAGLLGLMLIQHSRRASRLDQHGDIVLLADQNRALWDRPAIREGLAFVDEALGQPPYSTYTLQAAIAAVHARARTAGETDWAAIVRLYDLLALADPGPIVELNRAIAVGMRDGPAAGLGLIEPLAANELRDYKFAHFAKADFLKRLKDLEGAKAAYARANEFDLLPEERRFVEKQLLMLTSSGAASEG
jgi:RNA polymerase sigma-70 factor (ECF subfamily)